MTEDRLQKILARAGFGSRRANEELILAGRVRVNGEVAQLGAKADPAKDTIMVDHQSIPKEPESIYIAVNKPHGILSEVSDQEPRETVRDLVPVTGHLFLVGRLDMESEGLILLTNDGDLTNRLTHPRYGHEKEYRVQVGSRPDQEQLEIWRRGVVLEDGYRTQPAQVQIENTSGKTAWLRVVLSEGRKRQIREMGRLTGLYVQRIVRVRIGTLLLGELKPGAWRHLTTEEVRALKASTVTPTPQRRRNARPHAPARPSSQRPPRSEGDTRSPRRDGDVSRPSSSNYGAPRRDNDTPRSGAPRRDGESRPAGGPHGSRPSGGSTSRPPRRDGDSSSRPSSGDYGAPRRDGESRPAGGTHGSRPSGGSASRPPRRDGDSSSRPSSGGYGSRPEGGSRAPRPSGGSGSRGPRRDGGSRNR